MGVDLLVRKLCKGFVTDDGSRQTVLDGIDLEAEAGWTVRLEGPSGAGKSTFLNLLSGLLPPDSGEVVIGGEPVHAYSESRRDRFRAETVGYVFQSFNLLSPLTVLENLTLPATLAGRGRAIERGEALEVLERLGLAGQENKRPYHLSVGQRQRVAVARALLLRPKLLLADEPTASLDAHSGRKVAEALLEIRKQGTTLVLATHDPMLMDFEAEARLDLGGKEATP